METSRTLRSTSLVEAACFFGWLASAFVNANAGYVVFITMIGHYMVYETFHFCCHVPENSFVRYAVEQGHTVFMVSWRNVGSAQGMLGWDDYLQDGVLTAIERNHLPGHGRGGKDELGRVADLGGRGAP